MNRTYNTLKKFKVLSFCWRYMLKELVKNVDGVLNSTGPSNLYHPQAPTLLKNKHLL